MSDKRRMLIIDVPQDPNILPMQTEKLPEDFGRNLDSVAKARKWLTNPHNWHEGRLFTIKWNGLLPTVSRHHGMRLIKETWDDGLPMVVIRWQHDIRTGKKDIIEVSTEE